MALPDFIPDDAMAEFEGQSAPLSTGSVRFEIPPEDGSPTIGSPASFPDFIPDNEMENLTAPPVLDWKDQAASAMSGYLGGVESLANFGQMILDPASLFVERPFKYGDLFSKGVDKLTGVEGSTEIGKGSLPYTAASYVPQFVLGPESVAKNAVQTLFTAGGATAGRAAGGDVGEAIGSLFGALTPVGLEKAAPKLASVADNIAPLTTEQQLAKTLQITPSDIKSFGGKEKFTEALGSALKNKVFVGDDLATWSSNADDQIDTLGKGVSAILKQADEAGSRMELPKFNNTLEFIEKNPYQAGELAEQFEKRLNVIEKWDGTAAGLSDLKSQLYKIAYSGGTDSKLLDRAIANDLKTAIEQHADSVLGGDAGKAVAALNKEQGKYLGLQDVLERADNKLAAKELKGGKNYSLFSSPVLNTGGAITSVLTGNPAPLAATVGLSTAKTVLNSSAARNVTSGTLKAGSKISELFGSPSASGAVLPVVKAVENLQNSETKGQKSSLKQSTDGSKGGTSKGQTKPISELFSESPPSPKPTPADELFKGETPGLITKGNIDLAKRPIVSNSDGSYSTVRSMSFEDNKGREILIPTVSDDGKILSNKEAIETYNKTGKHLGIFKDAKSADNFAEKLHKQQENFYRSPEEQKRYMKITEDVQAALDSVKEENKPYVLALAKIESSYNPKALGVQTSKGKAKGLFQFLDETAEEYDLKDPFEPKQAVKAAEEMFENSLETLKDPLLAMVAHQRGAAGVKRDIAAAGSRDLDDLKDYNMSVYRASIKKDKNKPNKRALETANYIKKIQDTFSKTVEA